MFLVLALPAAFVLVEAYPLGLHDGLSLLERRTRWLRDGDHVVHLLPECRAEPDVGQALIAVFSLLLAILMRRGLALSAIGIVRRSTPS
jgi:hypothetical protein